MQISLKSPDWAPGSDLPDLLLSPLTHLGLLSIKGEQTRQFIQGQVTSDINNQTAQEWLWGAHCDPKGKMIASFRSLFLGDELLLLMPKSTVAIDLAQLQKYAVFNKVELSDESDNFAIIGIAGDQATAFVKQHFGDIDLPVTQHDGQLLIKDKNRYILLTSHEQAQTLLVNNAEHAYQNVSWQALEILSGYPNFGAHHSGQFVPQMCNLQALNGISFTKGCYMGQETVARMKYRGGNKRALYIAHGEANIELNDECQLEVELEDGNFRRAGKIIEFAQTGNQILLSAVLPNDTEQSSKLRIASDDTSYLSLLPLPYSLEEAE